MFIICRSPKGGVGTSVVAAALALRHAHAGHPTVLVDLAGDQPDLLGVSPSSSLGIGDWAAGGDDVPVEALTALEVEVGGGPGGSGHGICWGIAFQHPPQQCDRSGFVERIVAVATFRGLHA